jgi:hypothetical protein
VTAGGVARRKSAEFKWDETTMCTLEHSAKQRHTTWRKPACMRCPSPASFEPRDTLCILVSRVSRCNMSLLDASPACAASDPALWMQRLWVSEVGWGQTAYLAGSSLEAFGQESRAINEWVPRWVCMSSKVMCFICLM